ncbi:hypothetical protein Bca52824_031440 [Brassica carinata]|uniref:GDT1 family protein n=1 Tax=Brassica carinata TaxID=52824 RepID=A0A8X7V5A6_BRACI|nr:hypothetical protein Bca52824_031440 [Brassica carinata]
MLSLNSLRLPYPNPSPPNSSSSSSRRCASACPIPVGFSVRCISSKLRRNEYRRSFQRNASCYLDEKSESEEKDRNLDLLGEPSVAHPTQRVLKLLAVSGSVALLGTDPAFAVSLIPQSFVTSLGDLGDISSGVLAYLFSELGDKTFFIAALLAARNNAATVFAGTFGALGIIKM